MPADPSKDDDARAETYPPEISLMTALQRSGSEFLQLSGRAMEQRLHDTVPDRISAGLWQDIIDATQQLLADLGRFQAARPEFSLGAKRSAAIEIEADGQRRREAAAVAGRSAEAWGANHPSEIIKQEP
jgi:hypothetical protein